MRALMAVLMMAAGEARNIDVNMKSGGIDRYAWLHLPSKNTGGKLPLVVNLHALACNPEEESLLTDFSTLGDKEGFAVVYPKGYDIAQPLAIPELGPLPWGVPGGRSWNAGACCPHANTKKRDDVQFIRDLIAKLLTEHDIDETRVYATGMSNGGFFTNRLACEARELFAAVAPVSGNLANRTSPAFGGGEAYPCPQFKPPLPVLYFNGDFDPFLIWAGNPVYGFPGIPQYINTLLRLNGLDPESEKGTVSYKKSNVECLSYGSHDSNVTRCRIGGGGHSWPGAHNPALCRLQALTPGIFCSMNIDATEQIWAFFKRYSLKKVDAFHV
jgi:polyhydroxybutyrate depolymerase